MSQCHICLDNWTAPVSLPCGHIFCTECLRRAINAIKSYSNLHSCPACRSLYSTAPIDLANVPPHIRAHITPTIRRVYLDPPSIQSSTSRQSSDSVEVSRLKAENLALRTNCGLWRKRAEVHSATTLGLLELTRLTRDQVVQISRERNAVQARYNTLKRRIEDDESIMRTSALPIPWPDFPTRLPNVMAELANTPSSQQRNVFALSGPTQVPVTFTQPLPPISDAVGEPPKKRVRLTSSSSASPIKLAIHPWDEQISTSQPHSHPRSLDSARVR